MKSVILFFLTIIKFLTQGRDEDDLLVDIPVA